MSTAPAGRGEFLLEEDGFASSFIAYLDFFSYPQNFDLIDIYLKK